MARGKKKEEDERAPDWKSEQQVVELKRSQSSVEIKRDPKGVTSFVVKVYSDTVEEAEKKATEIYEILTGKL